MITVAVSGGQDTLAQLRRMCRGLAPGGQPVTVTAAGAMAGRADILVALKAPCPPIEADILVAPGHVAVEAAGLCGAQCLVTVGLSPRDTLTPSAVVEGCMATLQRELTGPGGTVSPREVRLSDISGTLDEKMAVAATVLLLDSGRL